MLDYDGVVQDRGSAASILDEEVQAEGTLVPQLDLDAPEWDLEQKQNGFPNWILDLDLSSADAILKPEKTV